jgi:hypothetical protein
MTVKQNGFNEEKRFFHSLTVPGYPRIKEWAYAGLMIDLIGATYSIMSIGAPVPNYAFMILPVGLGILSYIWYHKKLKLITLIPSIS